MSIQVSNTKVRIDGDSRFVLRDGSEKEGNILVSDAEGNATWKSGRGLVGQDRYIGEPYGGGTVVGIWRENGEEKVLIASHITPPVYSPGFGGPYNFETASGPWGMTSQYQGTMSYYKFGCFSPGDGSFNTYKAYEAAKEFGFTLFYGIAFYYNYPKVLSDYFNNPGLSHSGYADWYVPSVQEMKMVMDNAFVFQRSQQLNYSPYRNQFQLDPFPDDFGAGLSRNIFWTSTEPDNWDEGIYATFYAYAYDVRLDKFFLKPKWEPAAILLVRTEVTKGWLKYKDYYTTTTVGYGGFQRNLYMKNTPLTARVTLCLDATDKLSYNDATRPNRWTDVVTAGLTSSRSFFINSSRYSSNFGGYFSFTRGASGNTGTDFYGTIFGLRTIYADNDPLSSIKTHHISMELWFRPRKPTDATTSWFYRLVSFPSASFLRDSVYSNPGISVNFNGASAQINVHGVIQFTYVYATVQTADILDKWTHLVVSAPLNEELSQINTQIWLNGKSVTALIVISLGNNSSFDLGFGVGQMATSQGSLGGLGEMYGPLIGNFRLGGNQEIELFEPGFDIPKPYQPGSFFHGDISLFRTFDRLMVISDVTALYNDKVKLYQETSQGTHVIDQSPGPGTFSVLQPLQLVLPGKKNLHVLRSTANGTASWVEKNYLFYRADNRREIGDYYGGGIIVNISNYPANVYTYTIMSMDDIRGPYLGTFSYGKETGIQPYGVTKSNRFFIESYNLQSELAYYQQGGPLPTGGNAPNQFYPHQYLISDETSSIVYDPLYDAYMHLGYYPTSPTSYGPLYNQLLVQPGYSDQRAIRYNAIGSLVGTQIMGVAYMSNNRNSFRATWQHRNVGYMWNSGVQVSTLATSMWDGVANTNQIMKFSNPTWSAAAATRLFSVDQVRGSQGFTDWYLPAIYELEQAFKNLVAASGKTRHTPGVRRGSNNNIDPYQIVHTPTNLAGTYWSSTEKTNQDAYYYNFGGLKDINLEAWPGMGINSGKTGINVGTKNERRFVRAFRKVSILANFKRWGEPSPNDEPALDWYVEPNDEKNWTPYPGLKKNAVFNVDTDRPPSYNGRFLGWSSTIYNRQNGVLGTPSTGTVLQGVTWSATEVALYFNGTWSAPGVTFKRDSYIEFNGPYNITLGSPWVASDIIEVWCKPTHEVSSITTARGIVCTHGFSVDSSDPAYFDRVYAGYNLSLTQNDGSDTYNVVLEYGNNLGAGAANRMSLTSASRPVIKDRWNHIVAEFSNLNKVVTAVKVWVNGKSVAQTTFMLAGGVNTSSGFSMTGYAQQVENNASGKVLIGCLWVGAKYVFEGWIGKVRTYVAPPYTNGITDNEVSNNYQKDRVRYNAPSPITYLVAQSGLRLHLDAGSYAGGGIWNDLSGNFNQSSGQTRVYAPIAPTFVSVTKSAGYFTMASNYFVVPGNSALANFNSGITIIVIADFGAADAAERLVDFGNGQGFDNIIFSRLGNSNNLVYQVFNGSQTLLLSAPLVNGVIPNQWGFYGVRSSSTSTKLFNQFTSVTYNTSDLPADVTRNSSFIGKSNWAGDANFSGRLAVVAVWNRALTDREIDDFYRHYKDRYNFGFTGA